MRLLTAAAAAALMAFIVLPPTLLFSDCQELGVGVHADPGEALLHRIKPFFSQEASAHMPLTSLWATETCRHSGPAAFKLRLAVSLAAPGLLVLVLSCLLGSPAAATLALALAIAAGWSPDFTLQWVYTAFVLLAAALLAWRARAPSLWRSLLAGLAIGAGLLYRSPLVLFPPILILYEWLVVYRGSLKNYWKHAAILLLTPYLFLLPWTLMNWASHQRFIPLENGEADCIIMTGALGLAQAAQSNCRALKENSGEREHGGALRWAAAQIFHRPLPYLKACASRLAVVLRLQPHLFLGALAAFWLLRRRAELTVVGLLALYFLMIHCMLAIQSHYFIPLWPLLAAIASLLPSALRRQPPPRLKSGSYRLAVRGLAAALVLALVLSSSALAQVTAYWRQASQGRFSSNVALETALADAPQDAWLLSERGRRRLSRAELKTAVADFSRALSLDPSPERHLDLARALAVTGLTEPLLRLRPSELNSAPETQASLYVHRALVWLEGHRSTRAQEDLALARATLASRPAEGRRTTSLVERGIIVAMAPEIERQINDILEEGLADRPPTRRRKLLEALLVLEPQNGRLAIQLAEAAAQDGDRESALSLIKRSEVRDPDQAGQRRIVALYARLNNPNEALRALLLLTARRPSDASLWMLQAELALANGDRAAALGALSRTDVLACDNDARRRSARLYEELGRGERALELLERLGREHPREAETWLALAETAERAGLRERALSALAGARALEPEPADRKKSILRMAGLYSKLGRPGQTMELLQSLDRKDLLEPEARLRMGRLYCELGRHEQAAGLLEPLSREHPKLPEIWISLAEAHWRAGRRAKARAALARTPTRALEGPQILRLAMLSRELGERARSAALLRALLDRAPGDPQAWLEQGRLAIASANRPLALSSLSRASALNPPGELRRAIALAYQSLGEYSRALVLWDGLIAEGSRRASDFSDRGLCRHLNGSTRQALADLEAAIRLDPGFLPAYLTLGSIHEAQGRLGAAAALYKAALAAEPRQEMKPLRERIEKIRVAPR